MDSGDRVEEPSSQKLLIMEQWDNAQFPVACDDAGSIYLPVRALCLYLGIASQMQIKTLRKSRSMSRYLRRFTLSSPAGGGRQAQWCLHIRALAFWLAGHIDAGQVRPELQEGLLEWQDTLIQAAHELFFGTPISLTELDEQSLAQRLRLAEFEIQRLKLAVRLQSRRLGVVEKFTLPETYFDFPDDDPDN
jgi:P22_AR N-terminal domain